MTATERTIRVINAISNWTGKIVSWLATFLVFLIVVDVIRRYAFGRGSAIMHELEFYFYAAIFTLGAAYTLYKKGHIRVDVFSVRWPSRKQAITDIVFFFLLFLPFVVAVIWRSTPFWLRAIDIREGSPSAGGLPYIYLLKGCLPVGFFLLLLQGISQFLQDVLVIRRKAQ